MFINLTNDIAEFTYGRRQWKYGIDEILELGLAKKKKRYFLENATFIGLIIVAYYFMCFSHIKFWLYAIPTVIFCAFIFIAPLIDSCKYDYHIVVIDIYNKKTKIKIRQQDKLVILKKIDDFLKIKFDHITSRKACS